MPPIRSLLVLLAIATTCSGAFAKDTVYVRNRSVPQPFVERTGDIYVPAETILELADRMGMKFLSLAGFHPLVMVSTLEKLQKAVAQREPLAALAAQGASTHPPLRDRIRIAKNVYDHFFEKR